MSDHLIMQWVLCALLILSGILRLTRRTLCRQPEALPATLTLAGLLTAVFCLIIVLAASQALLLPALLLLVGFATGAAALQGSSGAWTRTRSAAAVLLALWTAALLVATVLVRERSDTNILLRFDALEDVMRRSDLSSIKHLTQNVLLFLPLGVLLPFADAQRRSGWLNVLSTALLMTATIEAAQLLFQLGQADVEDLLANILGAMTGWGMQHLLCRKSDSE